MLQDQTAQINDMMRRLAAGHMDRVGELITLHSIAAVLTAAGAFLLYKTAAGTLNSRFLKHLAGSVALNVVFRLGSVMYLLLKECLAFFAEGYVHTEGEKTAGQLISFRNTLEVTWHSVDITISLLSSWFLLMTWRLLRTYPKEGLNTSFYAAMAGGIGAVGLTILSNLFDIAQTVKDNLWAILDFVDMSAVTAGLILVGWQLRKTLGPNLRMNSVVARNTLPAMTTFAFVVWGLLQPLYLMFKYTSWYSILLVMVGFSSITLTVILCSKSLIEKQEYDTGSGSEPPQGDGLRDSSTGGQ